MYKIDSSPKPQNHLKVKSNFYLKYTSPPVWYWIKIFFPAIFFHGITKNLVCFVFFSTLQKFDETVSNMSFTNITKYNCVFSKSIVNLYS